MLFPSLFPVPVSFDHAPSPSSTEKSISPDLSLRLLPPNPFSYIHNTSPSPFPKQRPTVLSPSCFQRPQTIVSRASLTPTESSKSLLRSKLEVPRRNTKLELSEAQELWDTLAFDDLAEQHATLVLEAQRLTRLIDTCPITGDTETLSDIDALGVDSDKDPIDTYVTGTLVRDAEARRDLSMELNGRRLEANTDTVMDGREEFEDGNCGPSPAVDTHLTDDPTDVDDSNALADDGGGLRVDDRDDDAVSSLGESSTLGIELPLPHHIPTPPSPRPSQTEHLDAALPPDTPAPPAPRLRPVEFGMLVPLPQTITPPHARNALMAGQGTSCTELGIVVLGGDDNDSDYGGSDDDDSDDGGSDDDHRTIGLGPHPISMSSSRPSTKRSLSFAAPPRRASSGRLPRGPLPPPLLQPIKLRPPYDAAPGPTSPTYCASLVESKSPKISAAPMERSTAQEKSMREPQASSSRSEKLSINFLPYGMSQTPATTTGPRTRRREALKACETFAISPKTCAGIVFSTISARRLRDRNWPRTVCIDIGEDSKYKGYFAPCVTLGLSHLVFPDWPHLEVVIFHDAHIALLRGSGRARLFIPCVEYTLAFGPNPPETEEPWENMAQIVRSLIRVFEQREVSRVQVILPFDASGTLPPTFARAKPGPTSMTPRSEDLTSMARHLVLGDRSTDVEIDFLVVELFKTACPSCSHRWTKAF